MPANKAEIGIAWGLMHFPVMMHYHVMYGTLVRVGGLGMRLGKDYNFLYLAGIM